MNKTEIVKTVIIFLLVIYTAFNLETCRLMISMLDVSFIMEHKHLALCKQR